MKDWEIIADNLSKAGWSWGFISTIAQGRLAAHQARPHMKIRCRLT
jgi:hypothetical protein